MKQDQRIAIVGGGLAGLATAHALKTVGIKADVYETAPQLGEIGAAVNTSPNANKALIAIGVGAEVAAVGNSSPGIYTRNMQSGEYLEFRDRRTVSAKYSAPYYTFHRADLLDALAKGLDRSTIHLGHRLTGIEERGDTVALTFANGAKVETDIVIAADGVRSVIRQALYGDDNPSYTGQMVWRALLKGSDVPPEILEPTGHIQWVGPGCHLLAYYIRGSDLVNIVTQEDTDKWVEEGWSTRGDPDEMRRSFPKPEPRLEKLLSLVNDCSKWGLFTRPLTDNWGHNRVQLIGDAAHAMLPNAGQGACMAFEDAYILARWLAAESDPIEAFRQFRRVRIPRVHAVQRLSMANAKFKHMRDSEAQKAMIAAGTRSAHGNTEWVWAFDPVAEWDKLPVVPKTETPVS
ncbi:MAG TPA: FAD-dependent monooxygenase [Stellaceae bacterium]|jgi:salicylate hydroxylase|nr:FAD-dependent monooxygenase [Stellaceae bacterium]